MPNKEKNRVALTSVIAAIFLTGTKLIVGLSTGSLGILSEAAHSGLDLIAALLTLFAVRISDKPADASHHYGHGKIEGLSAFIEVLLLLITCGWIISEAIGRMYSGRTEMEVTVYSFGVIVLSIIVDASRSIALYRVAKKHKSQALEADALHFSSDIWSSLVVLFGLVAYRYFNVALADAVAALIVAVLVIVISIRLGKRTIDILLDRAPAGMDQRIRNEVCGIEGISSMENLRIRSSGTQNFVDMKLTMNNSMSLEDSHSVANRVEDRITAIYPDTDIVVHIEPSEMSMDIKKMQKTISRIFKNHKGLFVSHHNLKVAYSQNRFIATIHLVMDGKTTIDDAHEICDHLERDIKTEWPGVHISIHVEPNRA